METHEPTSSKQVKSSSELTTRQIINLLKDCELTLEQISELQDWLWSEVAKDE